MISASLVILVSELGIVLTQNTTTVENTPWKEFGAFVSPIQKRIGVFHNENGVYIS